MTNETPQTLAAVDLGSNSFHAIVARLQNGKLDIVDRLREPVRLAEGLTEDNQLDQAVRERAIACLERFGQRLGELPQGSVRAVGTNTLRRAQRATGFLEEAHAALGHPIEIISGMEEARLIYGGVAQSIASSGENRLVVDIGGGSTELIVGEDMQPVDLESLYMGCVSFSKRFFANGEINKAGMREAILAARLELEPIEKRFRKAHWEMATGASGTIKAIREIVVANGWSEQGITWSSLKKLRKAILAADHIDNLQLAGLSESRRPVLAGGFAVLYAVFDALDIEEMNVSQGALREGVLYDMLGRLQDKDPRDSSVDNMLTRFHVDAKHGRRVEQAALQLFSALGAAWSLDQHDWPWLKWSARLHEIGLVVAHSGYHKHGAYLVQNFDLAGFTIQEQCFLSLLVRGHRRKIPVTLWKNLPDGQQLKCQRLTQILRLAVLLKRGRSSRALPPVQARIEEESLSLVFPEGWLEDRPLTLGDLREEKRYWEAAGFSLLFE